MAGAGGCRERQSASRTDSTNAIAKRVPPHTFVRGCSLTYQRLTRSDSVRATLDCYWLSALGALVNSRVRELAVPPRAGIPPWPRHRYPRLATVVGEREHDRREIDGEREGDPHDAAARPRGDRLRDDNSEKEQQQSARHWEAPRQNGDRDASTRADGNDDRSWPPPEHAPERGDEYEPETPIDTGNEERHLAQPATTCLVGRVHSRRVRHHAQR